MDDRKGLCGVVEAPQPPRCSALCWLSRAQSPCPPAQQIHPPSDCSAGRHPASHTFVPLLPLHPSWAWWVHAACTVPRIQWPPCEAYPSSRERRQSYPEACFSLMAVRGDGTDTAAHLVLLLEAADVMPDGFHLLPARALDDIISPGVLICCNEVWIIDPGQRRHLLHVGHQLPLQLKVQHLQKSRSSRAGVLQCLCRCVYLLVNTCHYELTVQVDSPADICTLSCSMHP